jgi:uncharacterized protein with GYD domain
MAAFISLLNFTEQGVKNFRSSPDRSEAFKAMAKKMGVTVKDIYWTIGAYDIVLIMDAPDDETVAALMISLGSLGNVKTQTLRAFDSIQLKKIISKATS